MSVIDTAFVEIRPLFTGFAAQTEAGIVASEASLTKASAGVGLTAGKGFIGGFSKGFIGLTVASFGVAELSKRLREAANVAGTFQKSTEAIGLEFGKSGKAVTEFANSAKSIGIGANESAALSVRIGILSHNLGIGQVKAAQMAIGLQELAGSIAEIRGIDPSTVLTKLPQALAGNLRSLKELGFSFSNAQIKQEAIAEGALKLGAALTPTSKAIGVYGLLSRQLGFFQAQAAQHTGDLTTQQHILAATTEDTNIKIGSLIRGPLASITKGLVAAQNAVAGFISRLSENAAVVSVFRGLGSSLGGLLSELKVDFRLAAEASKPFLIVIGVTLLAALKVASVGIGLLTKSLELQRRVFVFVTGIIVASIDKFLGAFSFLARGLSVLPFIGDKFKGVADKIDAARERLRIFSGDLSALDGTTVEVNLDLRVPSAIVSKIQNVALGAAGTVGRNAPGKPFVPTPNIPPVLTAKETQLQDAVSLSKTDAGRKENLAALAAFYAKVAANDRFALALRRGFRVKQRQALDEIAAIDKGIADDAKSAARDRQSKADAAVSERQGFLEATLRLAQGTTTLQDDINAEKGLIAFFRSRVAILKATTAAAREALTNERTEEANLAALFKQRRDRPLLARQTGLEADLRLAQAQNNLDREIRDDRKIIVILKARARIAGKATAEGKALLADAASKQNELNALISGSILDRLNDNVTLAGFTKGTADDVRALTALEKFYANKVAKSRKGSVARRKWKIELERVKAELRDLAKTEDATKNAFAQQAFAFLGIQQGFAANLASNLLGNTAGLVGGSTPAAPGSTLPLTTSAGKELPGSQGLRAEVTREAGGSAPRGSQLEQLIALGRQQLAELRALRAGGAHPEAATSKALALSGTEITHA